MEKKVVIFRESFVQSVLSDLVSVVFLCGAFYANAHYIQSKLFAAIIVVLFLLKMIAYMSARKNEFTDKQAAIDFINAD